MGNRFIAGFKKGRSLMIPGRGNRGNSGIKEIFNIVLIIIYPAAITVIPGNGMLCPVSLFATMFLLMADPGGIYRIRLRTMFFCAVILAAGIVLAGYSRDIPVVVVLFVFTWSFFAGMLNALGSRGNRLSPIALVSFIIFILSPHELPGMFAGIAVIAGGFAWISAVRLWRWPFEPDRPLLTGVAGYFRLISPVILPVKENGDSGNEENKDKLFHLNIQAAEHTGKLALLMIRDLKGSGNPSTVRMYAVIKKGEMLFSLLKQLQPRYCEIPGRDLYSVHLYKTVQTMNAVHEEIAGLIENPGSPEHDERIDNAIAELTGDINVIKNIISGIGNQEVNRWKDFFESVEKYTEQVCEIVKIVHKKAAEHSAKIKTARIPVKTAYSIRAGLKNNITLDSEIFRHSLRSAIVLAAATAIEVLLKFPYGYWIPLSAAIILRPGREESWTRARERIAGTAAGCVLAFLITLVFRLKFLIIFISVTSALIAFRNRPRNYFIYAVFWTLAMILIIDIDNINNWMMALERILYTLLGGVLAIASVHFILPAGIEFENQ